MQRYRNWALAVFCWDGLLPLVVLAVPTLVVLAFPKQDAVQVATNVIVPIIAFFYRAAMADRQFERGEQYGWQGLLFICGIFFLMLLDALFIVLHTNLNQVGKDDWRVLGTMYLIYFAIMAISLFPFRAGVECETNESAVEFNNL